MLPSTPREGVAVLPDVSMISMTSNPVVGSTRGPRARPVTVTHGWPSIAAPAWGLEKYTSGSPCPHAEPTAPRE